MINQADTKRANNSLKKNITKVQALVDSDTINNYPVHERGQLRQQLAAMKALSSVLTLRTCDSD